MKKIIINFCFLLFALSLNATIRTVSNSPSTLAQYNSVQAAVDASASGDTVYIHASSIGYGEVTLINKSLALIGPGWSPNTNPGLKASLHRININENCDNTIIQGLTFYGNGQNWSNGGSGIVFQWNIAVRGLKIIRNYFSNAHIDATCSSALFENWLIEGNYFYATDLGVAYCAWYQTERPTWTNILYINNIFRGQYGGPFGAMGNATGVEISHNLFMFGNGFSSSCQNFVFTNNIFYKMNSPEQGVGNSTYLNNITFANNGSNAPWTVNGNTGTGNIENLDPQMAAGVNIDNMNDPLLDYTISAGPANDSGTDGKDLGLLFDPTGFLNWFNSRNPKLPVVNNLLINSTANPGGNLEIHLKASQAK